ncbi:hypothetical protein H671_5g13958 [Cricetulus griseus]|nr:hypothetical protein H671_5g13958 [Cricetulus griseus]
MKPEQGSSQFQEVLFINCRPQCLCYWRNVQEAVSCANLFKARTSSTILKRYGESGQPYLVPDFRGNALSFSPFSLMLFVYMVDYIDGFLYVEPSLNPWDEAYLIMVDDFSDMFLDSVRQYFIEYFSIDVHEGYCFYFIDFGPQVDYFLASTPLWNGAIECYSFSTSM